MNRKKKGENMEKQKTGLLIVAVSLLNSVVFGQPGTASEPLRYVGSESVNINYHDGRLRPAVGVHSYEVMHANRAHPELSDGYGWTYHHQAYLVYWNGKFYYEFLSCPRDENRARGQTLLVTSVDGMNWSHPTVVFPVQSLPGFGDLLMHQRMGFHVAFNGRLLVLAFYSKQGDPNNGTSGVGRVVREIYADGTLGPIYFIRYNTHNGWNESNTFYPLYTRSTDQGFKDACNALLANKLVTQQWYEEDRSPDGFYVLQASGGFKCKAASFWHRKDGTAVGIWKDAYAALSSNEGQSWSTPVQLPTIPASGSKYWGQRTEDGRYAFVYNPQASSDDDPYRYPLVVITGDDGILFDNMLTIQGEMPPPRFGGGGKDTGPQYVRGIAEWNGPPPGNDLWVEYSVNKEDMWVSRVPLPVRYQVDERVKDDFENMATGGVVTDWNIYSTRWAPVQVVNSGGGKCLQLRDESPYDYAKAVRVFPEASEEVTVDFTVLAYQNNTGQLEIEVLDLQGRRPVRLVFNTSGKIVAQNGGSTVEVGTYQADTWYTVKIFADLATQKYDLSIDNSKVLTGASFAESVSSVERLEFRTGRYRLRDSVPRIPDDDLPNPDNPVPLAVFDIDNVTTRDPYTLDSADLNEDGVVNFIDFAILLADTDIEL